MMCIMLIKSLIGRALGRDIIPIKYDLSHELLCMYYAELCIYLCLPNEAAIAGVLFKNIILKHERMIQCGYNGQLMRRL